MSTTALQHRSRTAGPQLAPRRPFSALAKPNGAACNLDCTYCFFLSKDLLYDQDSQRMSDQMLERFISDFLDSQPDGDVSIEWQGGEPTLRGLPFFRRAIQLSAKYARPSQNVRHSLQTNGTLLNDEWGRFLADNNFLIGLSVDGPAEYHDAYRVNRAGRATHSMVMRGWEVLRKYNIDRNILCTVHEANQDHPVEVYRYFRDTLGERFMQFIPIVERVTDAEVAIAEAGWHTKGLERPLYRQNGTAVTSRSASPEKWGAFMSAIFDEWVRRDVGTVFVQHFDTALGNALGQYSMCVHAPICGAALAMLPDGQVYACDHFVEPGYLRGNLQATSFRQILNSPKQIKFGQDKRRTLSSICQKCPVLWACQGGCPKDRCVPVDGGTRMQNYLCAGYKAFFSHIQPAIVRMAQLIQAGRSPAEVMKH